MKKTTQHQTCLKKDYKRTTMLMSIPGAALYTFFFTFPVCLGVYYSFTDWNKIARTRNFVGFENYINALTDKRFLKAFLFNFRYTILFVLGILILATIIALLLNQRVKGSTTFRALYFLPALFSSVTVSMIFNQIFFRVIPAFGNAVGISWLQKSLLSSKDTAIFGILFVALWGALPMQSILILAGLQTIPYELLEAAKIDGATNWKVFRYITIPHLIPTLSVVLVLAVKGGLMVFDQIKILTDGGPNNATRSLSILIYNDAFKNNRFASAMAEAIIVGIVVAAISFVQLQISNKKSVNA